nr:hypothetical protein [Flavobacteriales bacterium]
GYAQQNGQTGYVLVGWYEDGSTPSSQLLIIGIDHLGALAWARAVDHAQANEVIHLPNAPTDAVIAGRIVGNDSSMLALGIDDIGNVTWTKLVDGDPTAAWENANAISINADGTLMLAGALLYGSPGIYDEAFIARTMTSGIVGACDQVIPDLMSFPVTVTEADASHTIAPLTAPSFDVVLTPGTPMDLVATFCQSNEINGPGASLADPSIIVWYDQHRIVFAPELVVSGTFVVISDALGRLERVEPFIQPQADISMLPPGMHHVQLWTGDHMHYARIVKH